MTVLARSRNVSRLLTILSIVFLGFAGVAPAKADAFLTGLKGDWSGKGFVRSDPRSPEENIRCRLALVPNGSGTQLFVRGQCSIAGLIIPVNGSITAQSSSYNADLFRNLVQISTTSFAGKRNGSRLVLQYRGRDLVSNQAIEATVTIRRRKSGFDISLRRTDPASSRYFDIGTIQFTAR